MHFDASHQATLLDLLAWRRDVRHFRADPVDETCLARLQKVMDLAPSVGNARPWRVLRVESASLRAAVRENFDATNDKAAALYDEEQAHSYRQLKLAGLDRAPIHLAIFTEIDPPEGHGLGRQTMPDTLRQSTSMAIHTLWLAARSENLGLGMVSILEPVVIQRLLDVPTSWEFAAYLCLGHPEFHDDTPLLHRSGWQENTIHRWESR